MWDLIVSVPDHCLSFYFSLLIKELIFLFLLIDYYAYLTTLQTLLKAQDHKIPPAS